MSKSDGNSSDRLAAGRRQQGGMHQLWGRFVNRRGRGRGRGRGTRRAATFDAAAEDSHELSDMLQIALEISSNSINHSLGAEGLQEEDEIVQESKDDERSHQGVGNNEGRDAGVEEEDHGQQKEESKDQQAGGDEVVCSTTESGQGQAHDRADHDDTRRGDIGQRRSRQE